MVPPVSPVKPSLPVRLRLVAMIAIGAAAALASPPAAAQSGSDGGSAPKAGLAQLRQVFAEGRQAEDKGHWTEALDKFKEVAAVKMTPQVRFHIALCEENLGKLVSAIHGFEVAEAEATQAGSSAIEVPAAAKQHAEALRARIAHLRVEAGGRLLKSKIFVDDAPVVEKDLGTELDVDPGAHVVELRDTAGKSVFRKEVTLGEKRSAKVEVPVDDYEEAPPPPKDVPATPPPDSAPSRAPAYAIGAIGLAALAGSGVFFGLRASDIATVTQDCSKGTSGCNPRDMSLAAQGKTYTILADALVGAGGVGVGTGIILFFALAPKKQPTAAATQPAASLRVVPAGTGVKVIGVF